MKVKTKNSSRVSKILVVCSILFMFCAYFIPAEATSTPIDQACYNDRENYYDENLSQQVGQAFTPTKNTLDSITLVMRTYSLTPVKVKVRLFQLEPVDQLIAYKYISVEHSYRDEYVVDFNDISLSSGVYIIIINNLHNEEPAYITMTDGDCYPNGFSLISDGIRTDRDIIFIVSAYNKETPVQTTPETVADDPAAPADQSKTPATTSPAQSRSDMAAVDIKVADPEALNDTNDYSQKLASDYDYQTEIASILKDIEENRYRGGAFGLQGMVGRILTWPVFITICVVIFLIIIVTIVRKRKTNHPTEKPPQQ